LQPILTAEQMRQVDRVTIEERGLPGLILMENAGSRVYELLAHHFAPLHRQRVVVLCGKGNNGGDGLVVARHLMTRGRPASLRVILLCDPNQLEGDAAANFRMLRAVDGEVTVVADVESWQRARSMLGSATLLVDALLGTGLQGAARGRYLEVIRDVSARVPPECIVAVDIPSGLSSDSGDLPGESIRAAHTVTFAAPKVGQIFPPAAERCGALHVAPIGTPAAVLQANPAFKLWLLEAADFAGLFRPRERSAHKGDFGHVLLVGGSRAKPGAVLMAGTAALRAGAGLVTVATAASATGTLVGRTPELMTEPVKEAQDGSINAASFRKEWLEHKTVVAVGPGLGTSPGNQGLSHRIVKEAAVPVVVDADGLTALAALEGEWETRSPLLVLTPHPGEMARLTGLTVEQVQARRVDIAREFSVRRKIHLVLKGNRSLIATPEGRVLVNPSGAPAMATGGAGDILTGLIAGFLAQFRQQKPEIVIAAAVYLHGLCGELAAARLGEQSVLAMDLLDSLPEAIRSLGGATAEIR
jgi:ADP-dependent NAD(P)H-hydrate dehydratase / NAD(P)H-hydrate epimerase